MNRYNAHLHRLPKTNIVTVREKLGELPIPIPVPTNTETFDPYEPTFNHHSQHCQNCGTLVGFAKGYNKCRCPVCGTILIDRQCQNQNQVVIIEERRRRRSGINGEDVAMGAAAGCCCALCTCCLCGPFCFP